MVDFRVEVWGGSIIDERLNTIAIRAGSARPAMLAIIAYLEAVEQELFDTEGRSSGHPWASLAESTVRAKERARKDPRILRASERLMRALTLPSSRYGLRRVTNTTLQFGAKGEPGRYGEILMEKRTEEGDDPRRPIDLTERQAYTATRYLKNWITKGVISRK